MPVMGLMLACSGLSYAVSISTTMVRWENDEEDWDGREVMKKSER